MDITQLILDDPPRAAAGYCLDVAPSRSTHRTPAGLILPWTRSGSGLAAFLEVPRRGGGRELFYPAFAAPGARDVDEAASSGGGDREDAIKDHNEIRDRFCRRGRPTTRVGSDGWVAAVGGGETRRNGGPMAEEGTRGADRTFAGTRVLSTPPRAGGPRFATFRGSSRAGRRAGGQGTGGITSEAKPGAEQPSTLNSADFQVAVERSQGLRHITEIAEVRHVACGMVVTRFGGPRKCFAGSRIFRIPIP